MFVATATVRDTITRTEETNKPTCVLPIDFKEAFDRISHSFLFSIPKEYEISERLRKRLQKIYDNAT